MSTQATVTDAKTRAAYGTRVGIIGIACNVLLFVLKFLVGSVFGSLAICADAFNNLSDAGSSAVSYVSFRIAAKPADRDHPFGHARIEYIASMIVSFLILLVAFELGTDAVKRIITPGESATFSILTVLVICFSIAVKLGLAAYNLHVGRKIDSDVMRATATDCLSDCVSSAAVMVSALILHFTGVDIDAYVGLAVAILILIAGIRILSDTKNSLLGEAPVQEVVDGIKRIVAGYPAVIGMHDMVVHSYGPGHTFATFHAEVDGRVSIYDSHDVIDEIEKQISNELSISCTIHMDPLVTDDALTARIRTSVETLAKGIDPGLRIHDFRLVAGPTHSNLLFDVEAPFELKLDDCEIVRRLSEMVSALDASYFTVITVDRV